MFSNVRICFFSRIVLHYGNLNIFFFLVFEIFVKQIKTCRKSSWALKTVKNAHHTILMSNDHIINLLNEKIIDRWINTMHN